MASWSCDLWHPMKSYEGLGLYVVGKFTLEDATSQVYIKCTNNHHLYRGRVPFDPPGNPLAIPLETYMMVFMEVWQVVYVPLFLL